MNIAIVRDDCDAVVLGAGPYGLAVAAHLKAAKIATRVFGDPMSFWRDSVPRGTKLVTPWAASHIADPDNRFTLDAFAHRHGLPRLEELPLEHFRRYGEWFQRLTVPDLDRRKVVRIEHAGRGFCLVLDDGEALHASRVVIATGLSKQEVRPAVFDNLPAALVSHACEHAEFDGWRGKRIAVVGRGQSAGESAALLHEAGADVEVVCRGEIRWREVPHRVIPGNRETLRRRNGAADARAALAGPPILAHLHALPGLVQRLPQPLRGWLNRLSLRPSCGGLIKPRLAGVRIHTGRIAGVRTMGNQIGLQLDDRLHVYDHVLLATGYRPDIFKLGFWSTSLACRIACIDGSPVLKDAFESSVPGLHFVGASAVASYGPLLGVMAGTGYAARAITRHAVTERSRSQSDRRGRLDSALTGRGLPW